MQRVHYVPRDFEWTQWTPDDIKKVVPRVLEYKRVRYAEVKNIPRSERTFENTIYAIEAGGDLISDMHKVDLLMNLSPLKEVREAAKEAQDLFSKEIVDIEHDPDLWRAVKEYAAQNEKLEGPEKKLFEDMVRNYRRMGFDLSPEKQKELKENLKGIDILSSDFRKNINDYDDYILVTDEELQGLPELYKKGLQRADRGKYKVSLRYPDYIPFVENAENAEKRKELIDKNLEKGGQKNMEILQELLALREKNAALLGYKNHAAFSTEIKMAKTPERVRTFLMDLIEKTCLLWQKEREELAALKREETNDSHADLEYYDIAYYTNQHKKKFLALDEEKAREFFPFEKVKAGTFEIYETLFSVTFERLTGYPSWHEDVELYAIKESDRAIIAYFSLDLLPREGKYGHAMAAAGIFGKKSSFAPDAPYVSPYCVMAANFNKPSADKPSLLDHGEVETFFHEFGHVIHFCLTTAAYPTQAGYSVAQDFVEAPSQMLEHWVWEKETLSMLSEHYLKPEEKFPDELLAGLLKSKLHMIGYWATRQLILSLFDFLIHTEGVSGSIADVYRNLVREYLMIELPERQIYPAGFGHLAGGYDAGYYGYLWSKLYSDDMFTRFQKEGLLNQKTGMDYRKWILEKGSSMQEIDLVRGFLGREPNNEAFLKELGMSQ